MRNKVHGRIPFAPQWSVPPDKNTREWLEYFNKSPRLSVIDRIATDLSAVEGKLFQLDSRGNETEVEQHPFLDLWKRPNPLYELSSSALWRLFEIYLLLKGEGYFIIERDLLGNPAELWPVPVHWVIMTPYVGYPYYSIRVTSGQVMEVSVNDVFVMKELNPLDPYKRGVGKAESVSDEVETDEYAAKFQKRFFFNDATPSIVVTMPGSDEPARNRFLAKFREALQGVFKSRGVIAIGDEMNIEKLSENMKDMDMIQGRTFIRNETIEHFNVPREIMGITENSNRATADAAQFIYAQNVLTPRLRARESMINTQLLPMFGENLIWRFDDIVPQDSAFRLSVANEGLTRGTLSVDEWREANGFPELPNGQGKVLYVPLSCLAIRMGEDIAEATSFDFPMMTEPEYKSGAGPSQLKSARQRGLKRKLQGIRREQEVRFQRAAIQYFSGQMKRINNALLGEPKDAGSFWDEIDIIFGSFLPDEDKDVKVSQLVDGLLDWTKEQNILFDTFKPLWGETYEKGAEVVRTQYGFTVDQPKLFDYSKLQGSQRITKISKTTKDIIRDTVTSSIEAGDLKHVLAGKIQENMTANMTRANTIAQTEVHTSLMTGNADMMKAAGIRTKEWLSAGDGDVRDSHRRLNGKVVPFDQPFEFKGVKGGIIRLMYPGDPNGPPEEIINCRCDMVPGD